MSLQKLLRMMPDIGILYNPVTYVPCNADITNEVCSDTNSDTSV